jgi:hypothetical protein
MSNATNCRRTARHFARLAERAESDEARRAFSELASLWSKIADPAEHFDREHDGTSKELIYAMMEDVEELRHRVA